MAIGANWKEIWGPVWKAVWTTIPPEPDVFGEANWVFLVAMDDRGMLVPVDYRLMSVPEDDGDMTVTH